MMIFDALTYAIIAVGAVLSLAVFYLAQNKTPLKSKQENDCE